LPLHTPSRRLAKVRLYVTFTTVINNNAKWSPLENNTLSHTHQPPMNVIDITMLPHAKIRYDIAYFTLS